MNQAGRAMQDTPAVATLNARLNKVMEGISFQCERLESVLNRVNGIPPAAPSNMKEVAEIRPMHSLASVVEHLEQANQKLADLATNVEQIA